MLWDDPQSSCTMAERVSSCAKSTKSIAHYILDTNPRYRRTEYAPANNWQQIPFTCPSKPCSLPSTIQRNIPVSAFPVQDTPDTETTRNALARSSWS